MTQRRPKKSKGPSKSSAAAASLQARSSGSTTGTTAFQAFQQFSQAPPSATPYPDHGSGSSGNGNGNGNGSGSTYTRYEEDTAASLPPRVHIMLKHLGKKDAVTKIKALKDLQNVVTEDTNTVSGVVHSLQRIVERLSRDSDYRVREHLFHLIAAIAQSQRRALAPVLRSIAGPWLTSRHDPHPAVARAAQEAFDAAFAEDKRTAAWKHCASDVFRYANKMVSLSPEDMRDKGMDIQDAQDRFDRVVSSCIRSTAAAIANGTSPSSREQDPVAVLFDTVLSFLTDASSPLPYSRAAAFLFITSIAQHRSPLISPHASTIASTLVSHLSAPDAQVQHAVWGQALLTVLHHHRDTILPAMNPDTVVSGLETVLRSHPGRPVLQGLVPFLSVLPPVSTFFANVFRMYHAVFGSLLAAMESDALPSHLLPDAVQTYLEAIMVLALRDDGNHAQTHTTTNIDTETNTTAYTESEPSQPKQPSQKSASLSPHIKPLLTVHLPALLSLLLSSPHLSFQHEQMFAQRVAPTLQKLSERSITSSGIDTVIRGLGDLYRRYPPPKHRSRLLPRRDMAPRVAAAIRGLVPVLKAERMLGLVRPATCRAIRHASRETDEGTTDSDAAEVDVIAAGVMSCGADILINNNNNNNDLKIYFGCIDPGARPHHPGWPLRNYFHAIAVTFRLSSIPVFCLREIPSENDISRSLVFNVNVPDIDFTSHSTVRGVGWEKDRNGKNRPRFVDLGSMMDPANLAKRSAALNLSLMKWRMFPKLDTSMLSRTRCLLIGAGTLGCHVARNLMGWGVYRMTFVDQGRVSYSNPVRQPLFTFADCQDGGRYKAEAAAERLKEIYPLADTKGVVLSIPMPGHIISRNEENEFKSNVDRMESLIEEHDIVFLLTDSRESRWLPTVISARKRKLLINAALGFDSYVIMRHGMLPSLDEHGSLHRHQDPRLGCYFCSDIVAPGDSLRGRTLDQQCTVTRPGVSAIASALAVELLMALLHHPQQSYAKAESDDNNAPSDDNEDEESALGLVPHQIRGFLFNYQNMHLSGKAFSQCTACSETILEKYGAEGTDFIREVCNTPGLLEKITGLSELEKQMEDLDVGFEAAEDNGDEDFEMIQY
eukprot:gb/GECH01013824.1/.p1 GENE.gb/GECH01013824.1/~~gb/GECH01013824.1/.p1  ORF type:complete len:1110 (+),score=249.55 gb/GECH01013824.1/:1-3330(+)